MKNLFFNTVGELAQHLATLDPETRLTRWGQGGLFSPGISVDEMQIRRWGAEGEYALGVDDPMIEKLKKADLGEPFDALIF